MRIVDDQGIVEKRYSWRNDLEDKGVHKEPLSIPILGLVNVNFEDKIFIKGGIVALEPEVQRHFGHFTPKHVILHTQHVNYVSRH